jgi:hypothetical protein
MVGERGVMKLLEGLEGWGGRGVMVAEEGEVSKGCIGWAWTSIKLLRVAMGYG